MKVRNRFVLLLDIFLIILSVLGSFALRLDASQIAFYFPAMAIMSVVALLVKIPTYFFFGLYRRLWVYASTNELRLITLAVTTASVITSGIMSIILLVANRTDLVLGMPRSAMGIDWLISLVLIGGSRFAFRILSEQSGAKQMKGRKALIVGAGDAGALVVRELQKSTQLDLHPIGFLDDDPAKQRHEIYGVPVIGKVSSLAAVLDNQQVDEVVIAIPSAPGKLVRQVTDVCRKKNIPSRTMPGLFELIGGKVSVNRLREVDITDLLRREPVKVDDRLVGSSLNGKRVLVTGAGGSIGRELSRQIARWSPSSLVLFGHGENSIFETLMELQEDYPSLSLHPVIADVRDEMRLESVFAEHRPQVVFHAAAHKHVPLMEVNVADAISNNVVGTRNVVDAATRHEVERLVLISTDKAIRPVSVMGATKRLAEMIVVNAAHRTGRAFSVVRFGNVLGSRGSVVPKFKMQIARGGPVTVTHPDMHRYFMIIPEAVHLVLQAAAMGAGGEVFFLNMGQPVRILDLAEDLIRLSGLEPGRDIEIAFSGIRPGEKLTEELSDDSMTFAPTAHPEIVRVESDEKVDSPSLTNSLDQLARLARQGETEAVLNVLDEVIPGAAVRSSPPPDMTSLV